MADFLLDLIQRSMYPTNYPSDPTNPIGTYSPDETGENPYAAQLAENLKKFGKAKPPKQEAPPDLPVQTPTQLSPFETGTSPLAATLGSNLQKFATAQPPAPQPAPVPPVQTPTALSPFETGTNPLAAGLASNVQNFGTAKPPASPASPVPPVQTPTALRPEETGESPHAKKLAETLRKVFPPTPALPAPPLASPYSSAAAAGKPVPEQQPVPPPAPLATSPQTAATALAQPTTDWGKAGLLASQLAPGQEKPAQEKVPLPAPRPAEAPQREASGEPVETPRNATPAQGGRPDFLGQAGMMPSFGDIGSKIMSGLGAHSNLLLAMGAGLMGAPNVWQGLGRGFAFAGPAAQQDLKTQQQLQQQQATTRLLQGAGASPQLAAAAALDPDIRKQALQTYIADKGYTIEKQEGTNAWGEKTTEFWAINKFNPAQSFKINPGGGVPGPARPAGVPATSGQPVVSTSQTGGPTLTPQSQFYAPGVTEETFDQGRIGDEYLNQFSPEVQQAVNNYLHGAYNMTGGNKQINGRIKLIAQKYGHDIGMEADDQRVNARRTYETGLATPDRGVGKQITGFHNSLQHMGDISDNLVKMHLSNGWEIPGGAAIAHGINRVKGSYPAQSGLISENQGTASYLAREMGKMSGGTSKGEAQEAAERLGGGFKSGKEAAGALRSARKIIADNLDTMTSQRDELFPDERYRPAGSNFTTKKQQDLLDKIDRNIAILEDRAQPRAAAATPKIPPNSVVTMDKNGNVVSVRPPQ